MIPFEVKIKTRIVLRYFLVAVGLAVAGVIGVLIPPIVGMAHPDSLNSQSLLAQYYVGLTMLAICAGICAVALGRILLYPTFLEVSNEGILTADLFSFRKRLLPWSSIVSIQAIEIRVGKRLHGMVAIGIKANDAIETVRLPSLLDVKPELLARRLKDLQSRCSA